MQLRLRFLAFLIVLASGCAASVPLARKEQDRSAKETGPPKDRAALFIQRESAFNAKAVPFSVLLDGGLVGDLAPGTFFRLTVLPGEHILSASNTLRTTTIPILCEAAQAYYVQIHPDLWGGHPTPREISNDEGRRLVQESQLALALTPQARSEASPSSGTAWVTTSGYVITANHVIDGHDKIVLRAADRTVIQAHVVSRDRANDIAVLRAADGSELPPGLPIAHVTARLGATVLTVGFPQPEVMGVAPKMSIGNVSALSGIADDPRLYQVSVPLQAGNSGGPLVNAAGQVIGVVVAKLDAVKVFRLSGDLPEGVSYAVKATYLTPLLDSLDPIRPERGVSSEGTTVEDVAARVETSVLLISAE
jgi:hypothetical protein